MLSPLKFSENKAIGSLGLLCMLEQLSHLCVCNSFSNNRKLQTGIKMFQDFCCLPCAAHFQGSVVALETGKGGGLASAWEPAAELQAEVWLQGGTWAFLCTGTASIGGGHFDFYLQF